MSLRHGRWRRRTALLAAGALDGDERSLALAHVLSCAACARALAESRAALELVARDPLRDLEPPIPLGALLARVNARLDEASPARVSARAALAMALAGVAVALGSWVVLRAVSWPLTPSPPGMLAAAGGAAEAPALPPDALRRLEHALERERAAHYLSEAGDVLVTVAASPRRCARRTHGVEVAAEAERSRELLARRRLFVEPDAPAVASARDLLDDVEEMLRQVAALDPCARPQELEAIRGEIARRRLLMKIDLMTRELQG